MRLLIQPDDGVAPVLEAIEGASKSIDVYIFRLNYPKIEKALAAAVERGVVVRTLIAHVNSGGEDALRKLEQKLLGIGATVSRTDEDLIRYHGKAMLVDRNTLFVLGYNFTRRDIEKSRSLGIATEQQDLVREAMSLFDADFDRKIYVPGLDEFVVSPLNARASLLGLIEAATDELLIYDSRLSDNQMQRAIQKQAHAGVTVRVIGKLEKDLEGVLTEKYSGDKLHVRAIVQDGKRAFVGSQSLRRAELERRREIGVIISDTKVVRQIVETFEADWKQASKGP